MQGQTLLFFSLPRHDGHYTSTPWQLAVQLARANKVIFADHPFTFTDLIKGFFKKQVWARFKSYFSRKHQTKDGVDVIAMPFVFPVNFLPKGRTYDLLSALNHRIIAGRINGYLRRQRIDSLIFINSFNFFLPDVYKYLSGNIALNVYHCMDPMVKAFAVKHGSYQQKKAARESDVIITTAPALRAQFAGEGYPKTYLVPNAANFDHFNRACRPIETYPAVSGIKGKVLGYLGNIERRTDFQLLLKVLDILTDWKVVLAGPVERQYVPGEIFEHKRIIFTGPIAFNDAPSVVRRFDVTMIPFKCDEVSNGIYPLKLFEYMAAGKPVVSTNFNPEILSELSEVVHTADYPEQFADFVLLAYATDSPEKRAKRISVASRNTWEQRAQLFSGYLLHELYLKHRLPYVA